MTDFKETAVGYLNVDNYAVFSSSEQKWITKIFKLHEDYPADVQIEYDPEDINGMLVAHIPKSWLKIKAPTTRNMTDEQRAAAALRLADARAKRNG